MGNPAGVPRDFEALEKRRFQAIQMLELAPRTRPANTSSALKS
jgi:hypothetical protein